MIIIWQLLLKFDHFTAVYFGHCTSVVTTTKYVNFVLVRNTATTIDIKIVKTQRQLLAF